MLEQFSCFVGQLGIVNGMLLKLEQITPGFGLRCEKCARPVPSPVATPVLKAERKLLVPETAEDLKLTEDDGLK